MRYWQQAYVCGRQHELVVLVADSHLPVFGAFDLKAIATGRNDRPLVEPIDDLLGQFLDQSEVDHVAGAGKVAFEINPDLVVMTMQRLAETRIGDKMRGGEFQVLLSNVN